MTDTEGSFSQAAAEHLNSILITVAWQDSLGHPNFRSDVGVPMRRWVYTDFFEIALYGRSMHRKGNPNDTGTYTWEGIRDPLLDQKIRQYGQSEIVDGKRTVSFLASADWKSYTEYWVWLGLGRDTVWVNGAAMGNRTMFFEAAPGLHVVDQKDPALAVVVLTPGEMTKGHTEFVGIAS
jgi:hypothetical protein